MSNEKTGSALGGLRLYPTGLARTELDLKGGKAFWADVKRVIDQSILGGGVDALMTGKAAPRVWAFVAESGQSAVAVAAALSCAASLAERGQAVILVDGDDHHPDLTRWAGRFELEGWIDLIRYGASLTTCSIPMELKGRKSLLIGVGSFCPTQVSEQEIDELIGRLRRRADDILMIIPAGERGRPWAERAQICLLGWDQSSRSAKAAQEMVDWLDDRGIKLTGLVGFGRETDDAVAARLRPATGAEADAPDGPAIATRPIEPAAPPPKTDAPELAQETAKTIAAVNDLAAVVQDEAGEAEPVAPLGPADTLTGAGSGRRGPAADFWTAPETGRRSPNRLWWLAAVLGICGLVAGLYYVENLNRAPTPRRSELLPPKIVSTTTPVREQTAGPLESRDDAATGTATALDAAVTPDEPTADTEAETNAAAVSEEPSGAAPPPAADRIAGESPYGVPPGQDGWTLHVYSFPSSDLAQREVVTLERRGYRTAIRAVDVPDKGRWYRVYVGSFATREAALAARPELLRRLGTDWAMPSEF